MKLIEVQETDQVKNILSEKRVTNMIKGMTTTISVWLV